MTGVTFFLVLTGAQEMLIFVSLFVRLVQVFREQSIVIFLGQRALRSIREQSEHLNKSHTVGA